MDIVTHGMMGVVAAGPWMREQPVAAGLFMVGSVLPDLDAVSRVFGKRAFLEVHQTYTHSIPVILAIAGAAWGALAAAGIDAPLGPPALALGMLFHSLLDATNTYGIRLFAPFSRRRTCAEWVFFIDGVVAAATIPAFAWVAWRLAKGVDPGRQVTAAWAALMAAYWVAKAALRRRASRLAPAGTLALLPSAGLPWAYYGCSRDGARVRLFRLNGVTGALDEERVVDVHDGAWLGRIRDVPELRVMRELSPAYHVVSADGTDLVCRDLRTRNFGTRFGELHLRMDGAGGPRVVAFHV